MASDAFGGAAKEQATCTLGCLSHLARTDSYLDRASLVSAVFEREEFLVKAGAGLASFEGGASCREDVGREGAQAAPPRGFSAIAAAAAARGSPQPLLSRSVLRCGGGGNTIGRGSR